MEAIREYLNNMFMSLPETPSVLRAKAELMEMMEDKYEELISEGKSEKEAVGIVISEFGNLEELAEELGIEMYIRKNAEDSEESQQTSGGSDNTSGNAGYTFRQPANKAVKKQYRWTFDDTRDYLKYAWRHAAFIAFGVMFCILAPYMSCLMDGAWEAGYIPERIAGAVGSSMLFLLVAVAVALFCAASHSRKQWGNVSKYGITLDEKAERYVEEKRERDEQKQLWMRITGIVLCIVSVVPSSINFFHNALLREAMDASVLLFVGIGVCLIVMSTSYGNRYEELLKAVKNGNSEGKEEWVQNVRKHRRTGAPIAAIVIIIFAAFIGVGGLFVIPFGIYSSGEINTSNIQEEYETGDLRELVMDLDACGVQVEYDDVDKLQYQYSGDDRYIPVVTNKDGVMRISEKRMENQFFNWHFDFFSFRNMRQRYVRITIPRELNPEQAENGIRYQIEVDAGNVTLRDIRGQVLQLDVDAGNVEGSGCEFAGNSKVDVNAGNVSFEASSFHNLEATVDAGNFSSINSGIPLDFYKLDLDVDLGNILVDGEKMGDSYHIKPGTQSGDSYQMNIEVDLGNIEIS